MQSSTSQSQGQKNKVNGIFGDSFDTSSLSKEGMAILNDMQEIVPDAGTLFAETDAKLANITLEEADSTNILILRGVPAVLNLIIGRMVRK